VTPVVLDSSFLAAVVIDEARSPFARAAFAGFASARLIAPLLLNWEFSSVLLKKLRQDDIGWLEAEALASVFERLEVAMDDAPGDAVLLGTITLSQRRKLSAYDAAYLELALRREAGLATLDEKLTKAALAEGLIVHSPFA
jgi:predicted nucleic acid-binding protein